MDAEPTFHFRAALWVHHGGSWHFVTLPLEVATEIREVALSSRSGSVRVSASIGDAAWETSIFPEGEGGSFVLPIKKAIRTRAKIDVGDDVRITLALRDGI